MIEGRAVVPAVGLRGSQAQVSSMTPALSVVEIDESFESAFSGPSLGGHAWGWRWCGVVVGALVEDLAILYWVLQV